MKRFLEKWYMGLIILPILVNILTASLNLQTLLNNWNYTIIGTLIISNLITIYEYKRIKNENIKIKITPKKNDKRIINELLNILDPDTFQDKIAEQSCWYGYEKKAMKKVFGFCEKSRLITYKTNDSRLNKLIQSLRENLENFTEQSSKILYSDNDYSYTIDKTREHEVKRAKEVYPKIDEKTKESLRILEILLDYAKQKDYLE